jgi:ribosomal peptide maturation radical SAM protein 1
MTPNDRQDICLVCMPDCPVAMPPISLGILTAILANAGFSVKTLYANLWFNQAVGIDRLRVLRRTRVEDLVRDWLFTSSAFRDDALPSDAYLEKLLERNSALRLRGKAETFEFLLKLRQDAEQFIDVAARRVLEHRPRIVGCTSTFQQHISSLALLRRIRELAPDVVTMMGGANCETEMGRATHRAFPWVDFIVSGEADELIVPLCRAILDQGRDIPEAELPTGVFGPGHRDVGYPSSKGGDGVPRAIVESLAGAPTPDYGDYFEELANASFGHEFLPAISFESSRGCWWGERSHCTFCGLNGLSMGFRGKEADVVLRDIEELHRRYGATSFHAVDSIIDMRYFDTLLPQLAERKLPIQFFYETKSNLKRSHVELLNRAGVRYLQPGIESLCTDVLKLIGKGVTAVQNVQLLKHARQVGVRITWTNLLGLPNEKDEWYADSAAWMPLITHLQPGHLGWLRYDRYSPYYSRAKEYGLDLAPAELYGEVYPLDEAELSQIAYFFERRGHSIRPKLDGGNVARNLSDQEIPDDGPGRMAYRQAIMDWQTAWNKTVPILQCEDIDEVLCVEDTRAVAPERTTKVDGLAREVMLLLAEDAFTRSHICKLMENRQGASAPAINEVVDTLIERKLAMEVDNKIVNLVLFAPLPNFPPAWLSRKGGSWV